MARLLIAISLLAAAIGGAPVTASAAVIYKWVDAQGTTNYGYRPPRGVDAVPVSVPGMRQAQPAEIEPQRTVEAGGESAAGEKSYAEQRREERAERRAQNQAEAERLQAQCAVMQTRLAQLEPHPRVIISSPDGEVKRMDDEERLRLVNEARAFVEENCQ